MTLLKLRNNSLPTMDDFIYDFFGGHPFRLAENSFYGSKTASNVKETDKAYELSLSLPGFNKDDINIEINDGIITVSSEVEKENEDKKKGYLRKEFYKSSFTNSFYIPDDVDVEKIDAEMKNGILTVMLNKFEKIEEKSATKKISIK